MKYSSGSFFASLICSRSALHEIIMHRNAVMKGKKFNAAKQPTIDHVLSVAKVLCHCKVDENKSTADILDIKMFKRRKNRTS